MKRRIGWLLAALLIAFIFSFGGCANQGFSGDQSSGANDSSHYYSDSVNSGLQGGESDGEGYPVFDFSTIPEYLTSAVYIVNGNQPYFLPDEYTTQSYEYYTPLDDFGRCGKAVACIGQDIMPEGERESISSVIPTGWHIYYDAQGNKQNFYERAHLIAFQLAGENANPLNLISGTFTLNSLMQEYEEEVAAYVKATDNHVLYRVTPIFEYDNLLASGVLMEALSMEDGGEGICFNVYIYNVQPDYEIDYATGYFEISKDALENYATYVLNTNSKKFHYPDCSSVLDMKQSNKVYTTKTREEIVKDGYSPCGKCKP